MIFALAAIIVMVQQAQPRGPEFYAAAPSGMVRFDARDMAALRQRVSLDLTGVPLESALAQIARQVSVTIAFGEGATARASGLVSIHARDMTVFGALSELLVDTGLDVEITGERSLKLVTRPDGTPGLARKQRVPQAGVTIAGRVYDAVTLRPVVQANVRIDSTTMGAVADAQGRYTIGGVAPGSYAMTVRRVGYTPSSKRLVVPPDSTRVTLDFAMQAAPTKLDEVVTTAVGDQRRYEVGNTISTIHADSITAAAPLTGLTDLISARAPGVQVMETSGMVGSGESIRIRGVSSLVLQGDPILIVDGVRQDNAPANDVATLFGQGQGHPTPTRLNDINFDDIESIDVLKGPAASTEYGTDAANGVIVVTTRHGTPGKPRWNLTAEQGLSQIPRSFPDGYYAWGHLLDGSNKPVQCTITAYSGAFYGRTTGQCAVDSLTTWNPLNHSQTSVFGTGNRQKYDLQVSGGSDAVRYFAAGGITNEVGVIRMPPVFRAIADTAQLGLPGSATSPNSEQQRAGRVNAAIRLSSTADLSVNAAYLSTFQNTPDGYHLYEEAFISPAIGDAAHNYGYDDALASGGLTNESPLATLSDVASQNTSRLTGGVTASWHPTTWLVAHATLGLDHGGQRNEELRYPLPTAYANPFLLPFLGVSDLTTDIYSGDVRASATASLTKAVRAVTSAGLQMVDTRIVGQSSVVNDPTPTNLTLNGATAPVTTQQGIRQGTLGGYGEEQLGFDDRLFVTGAVRVDAGSGFGNDFSSAVYPKASVSWLALNGASTTLRLRGAFGESGVQPVNGAASTLYTTAASGRGTAAVTSAILQWPGNPNLKPERSSEFEAGADIGTWGNRLNLEFTAYQKTTNDALVNVPLAGDVCCSTYEENVGRVRNWGFEAALNVTLVQSRAVTWDIGVNASLNHNKLLSLAPGLSAQQVTSTGLFQQRAGYPLFGVWLNNVTYHDDNHDGMIAVSEVHIADTASFQGPSEPTREASFTTHVGLFHGALRLGALVDYRGGNRIVNFLPWNGDYFGNSRAANDPSAPQWQQARVVSDYITQNSLLGEDGSFVRFRELSLTYTLPRRVTRVIRSDNVSLTLAVRNLALWTRYSGMDPEVANANVGNSTFVQATTVNNDVRDDYGSVPLLRTWVVRLNVGL